MEETKNINNESTENKKEELYRYQVAEIVISDNEEIGCKYYEYDEVYYTGEGMEDTFKRMKDIGDFEENSYFASVYYDTAVREGLFEVIKKETLVHNFQNVITGGPICITARMTKESTNSYDGNWSQSECTFEVEGTKATKLIHVLYHNLAIVPPIVNVYEVTNEGVLATIQKKPVASHYPSDEWGLKLLATNKNSKATLKQKTSHSEDSVVDIGKWVQ